MPENRVRTWIVGAAVSPTLTCVGRSATAWIKPISSSAQPRPTRPVVISRARERVDTGAMRGRRKTLVTRSAWTRGGQLGILHQVAGKHRAARAFRNQQLLAVGIRVADAVHALGVIVSTAFDQEGDALAARNALEG